MVIFGIANIVTAFLPRAVGTKVTDAALFWKYLAGDVERHDFASGKTPGQALISNVTLRWAVSCGVGPRSANPRDYHPVFYRDKVGLYLRRRKAGKTSHVSCVVYTRAAYLADPDVDAEESSRLEGLHPGHTHVLVAVLASVAESPQLSPWGFVHNLAGGNNDYHPDKLTVAGLIEQARRIEEYDSKWAPVAD